MKTILAIAIAVMVVQPAFAQTATEKAEKRIAELVAPSSRVVLSSTQPAQWKAGPRLEQFEVPLTSIALTPPRSQPGTLNSAKPRGVAEGQPLVSFRDESQGPKQVELPTKPLIKLPAVDTNTPLPLPTLARPLVDRASLGEPAFEASLLAAMKRFMPAREKPAPFVAYNLPDPFEHVRYGQLRYPPEEIATPPVMVIPRPMK
jgi:hypothetical protein